MGADIPSTTYTKPVIEMLPSDLSTKLKQVNKPIALTHAYTVDETSYKTKVFILSASEMTNKDKPFTMDEGYIYKYYADHDDNASRVKMQIKGAEGSIQEPTENKLTYDIWWNAFNYAGYHDIRAEGRGSFYWLRSPRVNASNDVNDIERDGSLDESAEVCHGAMHAIAPAFCI